MEVENYDCRPCSNQDIMRELFTGPALCLAPLAGYSDAAFRLLCFEFGADFAVTEMVSAEGLMRRASKTEKLTSRKDREGPVGVQLFGSDPLSMAEAAEIAAADNPAFIDMNFGCPVKKVVRKNGGAGIMRDLSLMGKIAREVVTRVDPLAVTAKIRSGWDRADENYIEAGNVLQESGISAVTLHPRYRSQGFSGEANWFHIARLREELDIPVIANGDVCDFEGYKNIVDKTGCDIVMIGRGAVGRPWIFAQIKEKAKYSFGMDNKNDGIKSSGENWSMPRRKAPSDFLDKIDILQRFIRMEVDLKGERTAILQMRKCYRSYIRDYRGMKDYRERLSHSESLSDVLAILDELREEIRVNEGE
ncbi:MAG: tRNA-dihydrouridine synthase [Candidatus Krumholzibacteriota bacterium]|nr:tRNA-dihydrouridine synthase [Candidatus Krumholzibacteriota bacterium]